MTPPRMQPHEEMKENILLLIMPLLCLFARTALNAEDGIRHSLISACLLASS